MFKNILFLIGAIFLCIGTVIYCNWEVERSQQEIERIQKFLSETKSNQIMTMPSDQKLSKEESRILENIFKRYVDKIGKIDTVLKLEKIIFCQEKEVIFYRRKLKDLERAMEERKESN